ncbi:hypothetical protein ACJMK2_020548 [Sinanodonta woodiana]|uniref:Carbonic anhydrase n=1 Tax=Sinanodonta woodiana TaxID=1069815 RepID=A0ABD3TZL3_SINWO
MRLIWMILVLDVGLVSTHTLYKWILDTKKRFTYDPDRSNPLGIYNWPLTFPECSGMHQSPIDIRTDQVLYGSDCECPQFIFKKYMVDGEFENNGHSPTFTLSNPGALKIKGVPFTNGTFELNDFHLHFGGTKGRPGEIQGMDFRGNTVMSAGSEHTIDGQRYDGELHFVFANNKYKNLEVAEREKDGVVIIVIFVTKSPDYFKYKGETIRFSSLLNQFIPSIRTVGLKASTSVDLTMFFNKPCKYYTYFGSTTTPECHESVRWIILRDPIMATERTLFELTKLQSRGDFNRRFGNYRTIQPLNDRVVVANFQKPTYKGYIDMNALVRQKMWRLYRLNSLRLMNIRYRYKLMQQYSQIMHFMHRE